MALITVRVAGVDRTILWHEPTATTWEDPLNARGTGSITFVSPVGGPRFEDGQTIEVLEDGTPRFGGILIEPEENEQGDRAQNAVIFFNCGMSDYNILADRRTVSEDWEDEAFELIVSGIVTRHMDGENISLAGVQAGAAFSVVGSNVSARDVFDELSDKSRRGWRIDEAKVLNFKDRDVDPAPFGMNGDTMLAGTVTVRPDRQTYRNEQTVLAGTDEFPILAVSGNLTEQAARAAIEGTSGIYAHVAQNLEITNAENAFEWTGELLDKYDSIGTVVVGKTRLPGFHAGQEVVVNFPNHNVDNVDMLIDTVNAEVIRVGEDGDTPVYEIWYTIRAITGDPYGDYASHYRKVPPVKGPLRFANEPGLFRVTPTPGVVIHDPPPGPFEWFQAAKSGTPATFPLSYGIAHAGDKLITARHGGLANTDGCGGGLFPGFEGSPACFVNRQVILEGFNIPESNVIATAADFGTSTDELNNGANFKSAICISPDDRFALVFQIAASTGHCYVYDINANAFVGDVVSTMLENSNNSEPVWVGNVCYFIDTTGAILFMYDISDPANPTEDTFTTSLTLGRSLVASPNGRVLYGAGGTKVVALDISSPLAPVEDTVLTVSLQNSLDINDDGDHLIMCFRNDASNLRVQPINMTVNGTDISLGTVTLVPFATALFAGLGMVWRGETGICWRSEPFSPVDSLVAVVLDLTDPDAVTLIESLSYTHGISSNKGPYRSQSSAKVLFAFGGLSTQFTFGEATFAEPVPLTIEAPLRIGFGGTGLGKALQGDVIYADRNLPDDNRGNGEWSRLSVGLPGQVLTISGFSNGDFLPRWMDAVAGGGTGDQLLFMGEDILVISGELSNMNDLSALVVSGQTYYFRAELFWDADPELGHSVAIGGTAVGDILFQIRSLDDDTGEYSLIVSGRKTAFNDPAGELGAVRGHSLMTGSLVCEGDGTIVPQFGTFL